MDWKVEDMVLMNMTPEKYKKHHEDEWGCGIYSFELTMSKAEKIEFIDKICDGLMSYSLNLIEKFNEEKLGFSTAYLTDASIKNWIKKNDTRGIVDKDWYLGHLLILTSDIYLTKPRYYRDCYGIFNDFVDNVFHGLILDCIKKEHDYYIEHDEYMKLARELQTKSRGFNVSFKIDFRIPVVCISRFEKDVIIDRDLTKEEVELLISKYDALQNQIDELIESTITIE